MATIGVYGATGYTGRFATRWLTRRGHRVILAGRDGLRLAVEASELQGDCDVLPVGIEDAKGLRRFAERCDALIHCAGPFSRYGMQLVNAAIDTKTPYVDHTTQPEFVHRLTIDVDDRARAAGVPIVPATSFYTGLADLLVEECAPGGLELDLVTVAYHVDGWRPTLGTLQTGGELARQQRIAFSDREIRVLPAQEKRALTEFEFPAPLGVQPAVSGYTACCEPISVPRHTATKEVRTFASAVTFRDAAFSTQRPAAAAVGRRSVSFMIVAVMHHATGRRRAWIVGHGDIYDLAALISVLAAERLVADTQATGVLGPGEAFGRSGLLSEICCTPFVDGGLRVDELASSLPGASR